jgi:uncharacterized SAM-binding protein YcdF (DUF218 family)
MTVNSQTREKWGGCLGRAGGVLLAIPLLIGLGFLGLWAAGGFLVVADPLQKAEAAVVLSGDEGERIRYAITLYKKGFASTLILTETGARSAEGDPVDKLIKEAVSQDIPHDHIMVTRGNSTSTVDEANAVRRLALQDGIKSIVVVTDPYHTQRTRLIFRDQLRASGIKVWVRPVPGTWYKPSTWWRTRAGWQATVSEYVKILAYLVGYRKG